MPEFLENTLDKFTFRAANDANMEEGGLRDDIQKCNLLATPGLIINEKLVSAGRIPSESAAIGWVTSVLNWKGLIRFCRQISGC